MNFSKSLLIPENNTQQYREGFFAKIILLPKVALELFVIIRGDGSATRFYALFFASLIEIVLRLSSHCGTLTVSLMGIREIKIMKGRKWMC
ncbi:hypothetical protein D0856_10175 [Vibrio owensii]|nr:hypothetical protein D0856_10175 [Vibrio owensii]